MICTGDRYRDSIRAKRDVYINGEPVNDVTTHPRFKPLDDLAREFCGGQICGTPDAAAFQNPETRPWMDKYFTITGDWAAGYRRKLLALTRDMLNADFAGHRLYFQLFSRSPPFAHLAAVCRNFDWGGPRAFVKDVAGQSGIVMGERSLTSRDTAVLNWFSNDIASQTSEIAVG
ncbi:4-hydroxyphenylacetate 3-hydroxylase C-terminal domain-containing protein [Candidatus Halocynthiibacter alkanivorans]|uniref:4-hydroxyphenylacetate 3-hydroxylase C-terminal domain-containing protein n=1 Tax=Candidatus Halocynthiibacter alkanivorans TaxID=2267619 RepID=UPI000DF458D1|nr:4-hydroxyphenylacetate 3-hydroxylase C-terminal domain-containing protein [Candidatus Halocynthiibacter alkanivorans]